MMAYWKSLVQRCVEAAALDGNEYLFYASATLPPKKLAQLISWMAAHDCLADPTSVRYKALVQSLKAFNASSQELRELELDLDIGNVHGDFLKALAESCGEKLDSLRIECGFKEYGEELSILVKSLRNIRVLDIRDLQVEPDSGLLDCLRSSRLERVSLEMRVTNTAVSELETLVVQNPTIKSLSCKIRDTTTLQHGTALLRKIAKHLKSLVELELLFSFTATKKAWNDLLINCRDLKKLRLVGRLQFDVATMVQVQENCKWEVLELKFEETPSMETHEALQHLPQTLLDVALDFGCSRYMSFHRKASVANLFASLPHLTRIRYHQSQSLDDVWMISLLSALPEDVARGWECLDIRQCNSLTDAALGAVADRCPNLAELYLHDSNHDATCAPFDQPIASGRNLRVLCLNYFSMLSSKFLKAVATNCSNLEELYLMLVSCVSNDVLEDFAKNCPKLHTVDVRECYAVEDRGIIALAEKLPLVNLNVLGCGMLTDACVKVLAKCCPYLERFIYVGCPELEKNGVEVLHRSCVKRLKTDWRQWQSLRGASLKHM